MRKVFPSILLAIFVLMLPFSAFAATIDDIRTIIENDYVGEIDGNLDNATSIDEMMDMLDPYSTYFTKEEYESFTNSIDQNQTTVGIGVVVEKHVKGILILDVIENGSANTSGIEDGDIITAVNGKSLENMAVEEATSLIIGKEGTIVSLTVLKSNGSIKTIEILRKPFSIENVTSQMMYGNVGYIQLNSYSTNGVQRSRKHIEAYFKRCNFIYFRPSK